MNSAAQEQTNAVAVTVPQNALKTIAHELRQPLSAIESTAYYLGLVLPRGSDRARDHVARLRQLVVQSNWILSCGLQLADDTPLSPERVDLEECITEIIAASITPNTPRPALNLAGNLPHVRLDPGRGKALVSNLLMLFQQLADGNHRIHLKTQPDGDGAAVDITVGAKGYSCESALGPGSALCLSSVRQTLEAHGGALTIAVDPVEGIRLRAFFAGY